jgi:uncharacterized protein (DUF362 family)
MTKVAAVKADSYDTQIIEQAMKELLTHLGGMKKFIQPGNRVLVKANMLEGMPPEKAVTTHPEIIRAVIRQVRQAGGIPLVGDSPAMGNTVKTAEKCGILRICREEQVELLPFQETKEIPLPEGRTVKRLVVAKAVLEADKVISVAKMKTHTFMGITGAVKNLFGCFVGTDKAQFHLRMSKRADFAGMLTDLYRLVRPVLSIVDGIDCMEGNGPRNGRVRHGGILLAGADGFAVDSIMAQMMGFDPDKLPLTARVRTEGMVPPADGIETVGNAKDVRFRFQEPHSMMSMEDRVPGWLFSLARNQLTQRPDIADCCVGCGRCARHCPPQAIHIHNGRAVIDYKKCIRCYCCQELCPADAVRLKSGMLLNVLKHRR